VAEEIRILIVDDHPIVRRGLRTYLGSRPGMVVVGEAADGERAVEAVRRREPDVVLLDLLMPGAGGVSAVAGILAARPRTRILVLTSAAGSGDVVPAIRAGAHGYLLKDVEPEQVEAAVRAVAAGEPALHPRAAAHVMAAIAAGAGPDTRLSALTAREREVLALLGEGLSNRAIAGRLTISEKTVKTHVSAILAKLAVGDRTQAAVLAVRAELGPQA
jgi:DNA-binding NarL/FixJ family response regulator